MYSAITPLVMQAANLAVAAPAPFLIDRTTPDDWRREHQFPTVDLLNNKLNLLPGESYFLSRPQWSPYEKDGKTLKKDMTELKKLLATGTYDDYIVRDKRGNVIATTEDFTNKMVLNLDRPGMGIRLDTKGIYFGSEATVENIRTGAIDKTGFMPYRSGDEFTVDINAHSKGYGLLVTHDDPRHTLKVNVLKGGPGKVEFDEKASGVAVTITQDKPSELKEIHHRIQIPSKLAKSVNVEDEGGREVGKHTRTVTFGWKPTGNERQPKLAIANTSFRNVDDSATHSVDFYVRDQVDQSLTVTPNKTSYIFSDKPALTQRDFGIRLEEAGEKVGKEADSIRKEQAETGKKLPVLPRMQEKKAGGMNK